MSVFRTQQLVCPSCKSPVEFQTVLSVNADRRPDLRAAIIDGSFQSQACPKCANRFRLEPEMVYFEIGRRQWLLVRPFSAREDWQALETQARKLFATAFGKETPAGLRAQITAIRPRIAFGWAALREKILCAENNLDDATLELLKLSTIRGLDYVPLTDETELRLVNVEGEELVLAWISGTEEKLVETLRVPRQLYEEIKADVNGWKTLRSELEAGVFVDVARLLYSDGAPEAANPEEGKPESAKGEKAKPARTEEKKKSPASQKPKPGKKRK